MPPDLEESYAMVAIAQQLHYQRIALAFGNDIGSQTFVGPAELEASPEFVASFLGGRGRAGPSGA